MTDPRAAAVEAAAHASDSEFGTMCNNDCNRATKCVAACQDTIDHAQTMIRAYEARMAEAGWVMGRDVTITAASDTPPEFIMGWNACRAAMLGRDDPPRADGEG